MDMVRLPFAPVEAAQFLKWTVVAVICFILYQLFVDQLLIAWKLRRQGLPGSPWTPLVGDLPEIPKMRARNLPFYEWFSDWERKYGRLYYMWLGPELRLRVHDANIVKSILVSEAGAFHKPNLMKRTLGLLLGEHSMLLSEGEHHKAHRLIANPAFHFAALKSMSSIMTSCTESALSRWISAGPVSSLLSAPSPDESEKGQEGHEEAGEEAETWQVLDLHEELSALTLDIIGRCAFGTEMEATAPSSRAANAQGASAASQVYKSLDLLFQSFARHVTSGLAFLPGFQYLPIPSNFAVMRELNSMRSLLRGMITRRRQALVQKAQAGKEGSKHEPEILLDFLLEGLPDDAEVLDEALTFVSAGHETTANALTWAVLLLDQHPHIRDSARNEVLAVMGSRRAPTMDDLPSLPLLGYILQETLRMYPPAPLVTRVTAQEVELDVSPGILASKDSTSLRLPAGTHLAIPIYAIHRDPEYWGKGPGHSEPNTFDPSRWKDGASAACTSPWAYLPFSAGPRNCIGHAFAMQEAKLILAMILQRIDWKVAEWYEHKPQMMITLRPAKGLPAMVRARK